MIEQDKRCGTCKWFDKDGVDYFGVDAGGERGWCGAPVPEAVCVDYREPMAPTDGADCQCWEAKE